MTIQPVGYSSPTKVVKVSLAEYVTRGGLAARVWARGVVQHGEDHDPRPLYLSEEDERVIEACAAGARRLMRDAAVTP